MVGNKFTSRNRISAPYPREVFFLLADKCNARCPMCHEDYFHSHSGKAITLDKFKTIAANIHLEKMKSVILAGGEPLLNKDLLEIISFINHHYPRISIVISTNGIALTRRTAEEILRRNVHLLSVSLNAGTKEIYRKVMQVDCFKKVVENLKYYQELCSKLKKTSRLNLSFVASKKNIEDLPEFVRLAKSLGVKDISSTYCRFYPLDIRLSLATDRHNLLEDNDSLYFHQDMSDTYFKEADALAKQLDLNFTREPLFSETFIRQTCPYPFMSILIGFDGEVFPCCGGEAVFKDKVSNKMYDFGNALKQPIEDFWYNEYYQALRYSVLNPDNPAIPECAACSYILKSQGHIKKAHLMEWGDLKEKSVDFGFTQPKSTKS